jgi:hypothetical protein
MNLWRLDGVTRRDVEEPPGSAPPSLISPDIHGILYCASLAPSGHNAQPWSARLSDGELWIGTERSRWLPKVDPTNREVALSLGALVENLIIAAPAYGYRADCDDIGPSTAAEPIHVRLTQGERRNVPLEQLRARRTLRPGHERREISTSDVKALSSCAGVAHTHFFTRASKEGRALAEGTLEANRLQTARDDAQAELADWMRWTPADGRAYRNGFTPESLEITGIAGWYVRHFMNREAVLGNRFRKQSVDRVRQQLANYGGWIVVTSEDGSVPALIDAGRRCERMWLATRERSIAVHPMSQVLEESPLKDHVARDLGLSCPVQFILRVGYVTAYPDPVSLRMPVSWFLKI